MPFYHAIVRPSLLTAEQRQGLARDIVEVHCGVTGAPPSFVHVMVTEDHQGRLDRSSSGRVNGTIRTGRTDDQRQAIVAGVRRALSERASVDADSVEVRTRDIDASYTMEGGALLPEPGSPEEEAWKVA